MLHLDLFSGIGGFAYAADQVFGDVEHVFCDNDKFCRAVLEKHWPGSEIFHDIRTITADTDFVRSLEGGAEIYPAIRDQAQLGLTERTPDAPDAGRLRRSKRGSKVIQEGQQKSKRAHSQRLGARHERRVELLTGGFPCQPYSQAGLRRGTADERHLWPEMLRVIQLTKPSWVIAENVRGITNWNDGVVFEQVCADLEASGYEVQPIIIPAVAINAPHRRDRVWFIAHSRDHRPGRAQRGSTKPQAAVPQVDRPQDSTTGQSQRTDNYGRFDPSDWQKDWVEVAAQFCSVDDGLPAELDGFKLSKAQHRAGQLKAYGNAIVPQVAMQIMQAMTL